LAICTRAFGRTPWSTIPVELGVIRQIEMIKGPNTALFGFNAVRRQDQHHHLEGREIHGQTMCIVFPI